MKVFSTINISIILAVATAMGGQVSSSEAAELIANRFMPAHHPMYKGTIKHWITAVQKASGGKIKVTVPAASMAPAPRQWDIVAKGVADVAITANVFQRKRLVLMQGAHLPFTTTDGQSSSVALWRTYKKFFEFANEYKGMKLLSVFVHGGGVLQLRDAPITQLADFKKYKIRTSPGTSKAVFSAFGATVVASPGVKIFEYVSKGTVDGLVATSGSIFTYKIGRYIKYQIEAPGMFGNTSFSFFMNGKSWDSLSASEKKAVDSVSYEKLSRAGGKAWDVQDAQAIANDFKKYKIQRITASPKLLASMKAKTEFLRTQWIAKAKKSGLADPEAALNFYVSEAKKVKGKS